jgi:hypothetical protein
VIVPRLVVVLVVAVVVAVLDVVGSVVVDVVVVGTVVDEVVGGRVVDVVVVEGVVVVDEDVVVGVASPLSAATTASATPRPTTAPVRTATSAFIDELIPDLGGSPWGGWPPYPPPRSGGGASMRLVGSSCIAARV